MNAPGTRWLRALLAAGVVLSPRAAAAVQTHGGVEGLVAHELGHVLFTAALVYVLAAGGVRRWARAGRRHYGAFLLLAIAWNALTFVGHILTEGIRPEQIVRANGEIVAFLPQGPWDYVFYLTYLDHLLLVPALLLLVVALARWWRTEDGTR